MSDLMLFGVLRMPYEMAMSSELSRTQFYGRAQEAADRIELLEAEVERLRAEVREWLCIDCNTVYPGPPQQGVTCVICPKCKGTTAPRGTVERRRLEAENADLRAEVVRLRADALARIVDAPLYSTRQDAARYRWLRAKSPDTISAIAWSVPAACHFGEPDAAIDAAIAHTKAREGA